MSNALYKNGFAIWVTEIIVNSLAYRVLSYKITLHAEFFYIIAKQER